MLHWLSCYKLLNKKKNSYEITKVKVNISVQFIYYNPQMLDNVGQLPNMEYPFDGVSLHSLLIQQISKREL